MDDKYCPIRAIRAIRGHIPALRGMRGEPRISRIARIKKGLGCRPGVFTRRVAAKEVLDHDEALSGQGPAS